MILRRDDERSESDRPPTGWRIRLSRERDAIIDLPAIHPQSSVIVKYQSVEPKCAARTKTLRVQHLRVAIDIDLHFAGISEQRRLSRLHRKLWK